MCYVLKKIGDMYMAVENDERLNFFALAPLSENSCAR